MKSAECIRHGAGLAGNMGKLTKMRYKVRALLEPWETSEEEMKKWTYFISWGWSLYLDEFTQNWFY